MHIAVVETKKVIIISTTIKIKHMKFRIPVYKNLQDEQKVGYWTVFSNIVLILVTFWLGLYVQDIIVQRNGNASGVLANVEYAQNVKPIVDSLNIKYGSLCMDIKKEMETIIKNPETVNLYALGLYMDSILYRDNSRQDKILSYCLDVSKASVTIYPYVQHLNDTLSARAAVIPLMKDVYLFIINQYTDIDTTAKNSYNERGGDYMCKTVKKRWDSKWPLLKKQLDEEIRNPEYLANFGILTTFDTSISNEIKKIYDGFIDNVINDYKSNISKNKTTNNVDSLFMAQYIVGEYNFMINNLLLQSVTNHTFLSNHNYFKNNKKNRFLDNPIGSLIIVIMAGVLLAWIILQTLPQNNVKNNKKTNKDDLYSDYISELKYNTKLMKKLLEYGIDIPHKDEHEKKQ